MNQSIERFQQDLQRNYLSFKKVSEQLKKDYSKVINDDFHENEWNNEGKKITANMTNFEKLMKDLNKKVEYCKNENIENDNINNVIKKIETELSNAKENIGPMLGKIREKVKTYACDFQLAVNNEQPKNEKEQEVIMDLLNNKEILEKRREDLEGIHKTSAQLKDITDKMAQDLNEQGAILDDVEKNIINIEENAEKAKKEIIEADKISKSNRKCVIFYIIIILASLTGIGFIVWGLLKYFQII